jgi:hypothetical protein
LFLRSDVNRWLGPEGRPQRWLGHGPGLPLPQVGEIPPGLKPYADAVWQNLFYAGGGVLGATAIAGAIARRK